MALAGGLGMELRLADLPCAAPLADATALAFCESLGRFLVEVRPENRAAFEDALAGHAFAPVGHVRADSLFVVYGLDGKPLVETDVGALEQHWKNKEGQPLQEVGPLV
jgi:phosphoribosylformylglycinamidine synthase